jgi:hypothetical protein
LRASPKPPESRTLRTAATVREVPVLDINRFVFQGRDKVLEVFQRHSRMNSERRNDESRIVLEQIALGDERHNRDLMVALRMHQLDQSHPTNKSTQLFALDRDDNI